MMRVGGGAPLIILSTSAEREQGPKVQLQNINAAKVFSIKLKTIV